MDQRTRKCTKCGSEQEMLTEDMNAPKRCAGCGSTKCNPLSEPEDFVLPAKE
jgi:hypothetical protein